MGNRLNKIHPVSEVAAFLRVELIISLLWRESAVSLKKVSFTGFASEVAM